MIFIKILKTKKIYSARQKGGFTLLEVMMAISILAIVLTAVFRMQSQTLAMHTASRFQTSAPLLAQRKMAEIEAKPESLNDLTQDSGDFGETFIGYTWNVIVEDVEAEFLEDTTIGNLKKIDLTISYLDDTFTYDIRTYRFVQEE
jgi:general secretion pathway protein I